MSWLKRTTRALGLKLLKGEFRLPGNSAVFLDLLDVAVDDMARDIGDGTKSDVLMTPVRWIQRAMPEAELIEINEDGEPAPGDLEKLLRTPNEFYSQELLISSTVFSLLLQGNAYWLRIQNENDRDLEYWWVPPSTIKPRFPNDGSAFITHYEYTPGGGVKKDLKPSDVVHFREGVDPENIRLGLSPLRGLLREIWTDNEAAAFVAALLKNGGVPGIVVSPSTPEYTMTQEEADAAKAALRNEYSRDRRGLPIAFSGPIKIESFGFSPSDLNLGPLRNISEERVTAALGVPAAVVGFGAGLQQTKVGATMRELRQLAWWNAVIPLQRIIAGEINRALAPAFDSAGVMFDNTNVAALRENADSVAQRAERLTRAGIITRAEAKKMLRLEASPSDDVYLMPLSTIEVPAGTVREIDDDGKVARVLPMSKWSERVMRLVEAKEVKSEHSLIEERIAERESVRDMPAQLRAFADRFDSIRAGAAPIFASLVAPIFERLGRQVERIVRELETGIASAPSAVSKYDDPKRINYDDIFGDGTKADELLSATILDSMSLHISDAVEALANAYATGTRQVLDSVVGDLASLGAEIVLTDATQLEILRAAGTRAGLIDLTSQTRNAIFAALEEARAEGLAGSGLARRIREHVESGPWRSVEIRADVIARTEGAFAANTSVMRAARQMDGVEMMMIHDNRAGFGDDICTALDGTVVSIAEAEELIAAEHPNGTRSATPIPPLLAAEMGL